MFKCLVHDLIYYILFNFVVKFLHYYRQLYIEVLDSSINCHNNEPVITSICQIFIYLQKPDFCP